MRIEHIKTVLYAIALAMGIAGAVLTSFDSQTVPMLFGIGISCLAAAGLGGLKSKAV
jgi:hypothetical protein